jgi:hypothetical protein
MDRNAVSRRRIPPSARADRATTVRLLAVDLDGTLLNDSKQIGAETIDALRAIQSRGIKIVIATARPPRAVRHLYSQLQLDAWQINYNGALIWDEPAQATVFHRPMPGELARQMIDLARAKFESVLVTCEVLDRWYTDRADHPYTTETGRLFRPDVIATLDEICAQPITKLLLLGPRDVVTQLDAMLADINNQRVSIVRADPELIQLMDRRVSKAVALKMTATHYNIPMHQVMAIGDAPNDVGMLQMAGIAIAVDNGHALAKQAAHWVAPSNNDHGVLAALQKYGLYP